MTEQVVNGQIIAQKLTNGSTVIYIIIIIPL